MSKLQERTGSAPSVHPLPGNLSGFVLQVLDSIPAVRKQNTALAHLGSREWNRPFMASNQPNGNLFAVDTLERPWNQTQDDEAPPHLRCFLAPFPASHIHENRLFCAAILQPAMWPHWAGLGPVSALLDCSLPVELNISAGPFQSSCWSLPVVH